MKYYIHTLGCKVNTYESEVMSDLLENRGYQKGSIDDANIVIVNTCFVTNVAEHKSLQMVRKYSRSDRLTIVTGCLSQMKPELVQNIEGVGVILGNQDKSKIVEYIDQYEKQITNVYDLSNVSFEDMKLNNFDKTRAFVKIEDGCENFCSYCIIPFTRGRVRSKKKEDVIEEIRTLVNQNHREIVLTGIHTGNYGAEFDNYHLSDLLKEIILIKGLVNLRISSIEITEINDEVLEIIQNNSILVDHMHIPLQSGSNAILKSMNRKYDLDYFFQKIEKIRKIRPNISITTDVIVGFPGETEELFEETIHTIEKIKFTKLHVFPFSIREGTKAASMDNQVSEIIKKQRVKKLISLSLQLEKEYMNQFINKDLYFIPETYKDGHLIGHTGNYLLIKTKGDISLLHKPIGIHIDEISYPYCLSTICQEAFDKQENLIYNENR